MNYERVLKKRRGKRNERNLEGMAKFGINTNKALGISIYDLAFDKIFFPNNKIRAKKKISKLINCGQRKGPNIGVGSRRKNSIKKRIAA